MTTSSMYSKEEERANSLSHALGMIFGIVALTLLLVKAETTDADWLTIISFSVYGISIILLFLASTLYHSIAQPKAKRVLKTLDHCAIFLLIAGSYTPYLLVGLRTPLAYWLMGIIWVIAVIGIIGKIIFVYRFKKLSLVTYLVMGWMSAIVIYQLVMHIDINGVILLVVGGIIYSLGVIFYVAKNIPYNHAIWHLFVLGGCVAQFLSIYYYVAAG